MKRTNKKFAPMLITAAFAIGLAACGGDDGGSSSSEAPSTEAPTSEAPSTEAPSGELRSSQYVPTGDPMDNFTAWDDSNTVIDCAPDEGPLKAAWIYVGPINDGGWTQVHDEARQAVQEHFGDAIETTYKELVPEGPQALQTIEDLIADGNTVIFGTSFGFQDQFIEAAAAHPEVCFEFATGYKSAPNVSQFYGAAEDTDYLTGMAAGAASTTGKLGMVSSFSFAEVVRGVNAFALGAQAMNPDATVKVLFIQSWFDPAEERKAAEALLAEGVDVLGMKGVDSPATGDVAKENGIPWAGYNKDQSANYPEVWLTASAYDWSVYQIPRLQQILDGTWVAGNYYGTLKDGFVKLGKYGSLVSDETYAAIEARLAELAEAPGSQFTGPILDNQGNEVLADGVSHTYGELMEMAYLVAGVEGEL
jgi:basic membrane lipoprotein Med (substrate-binding protein (PBP1-ABC) superfamily)